MSVDGDRYESLLRKMNVPFVLKHNVPLSSIDIEGGRKNQSRLGESVEESTKLEYAIAMESGDKFPPIILFADTPKLAVGNGNYRLAACEIAGKTTIDAYVVECADPFTRDVITRASNQKEGRRQTPKTNAEHAVYFHKHYGLSIGDAAALFNMRPNQVTDAKRLLAVNKALEDCHVSCDAIKYETTKKSLYRLIDDQDVFPEVASLLAKGTLDQGSESRLIADVASANRLEKKREIVEQWKSGLGAAKPRKKNERSRVAPSEKLIRAIRQFVAVVEVTPKGKVFRSQKELAEWGQYAELAVSWISEVSRNNGLHKVSAQSNGTRHASAGRR